MKDDEIMAVEIDGRSVDMPRGPIGAADLLALAGFAGEGVVIRIDGGRASLFAPDHPVEFDPDTRPAFRTFRGGAVHRLRVGGLLWEWGGPAITEDDIRTIGEVDLASALYLDGADVPIRRGSVVDLTTAWPPQVDVRGADAAGEAPARVPVIVNGRSVVLERPHVSFEDLVGLAFPGTDIATAGSRALTVTYRRGPADSPEGSLVPSEAVRARQGEVFNVTATNKS